MSDYCANVLMGEVRRRAWWFAIIWFWVAIPVQADGLRVEYFEVDASPDIGSPLAYDPCIEISERLSCRGLVLVGAGQPIVLLAVDWLGIANEGHEDFRRRLAEAIGSSAERISLHTLHQHDAPRCDLGAMRLLEQAGSTKRHYDRTLWQRMLDGTIAEVKRAIRDAKPFDQVGYGEGEVIDVASNRRLLDSSGKVAVTRFTATRDASIRALPTGTIDPKVRLISFWKGEQPIVALTYYATHPQSYYRTGKANPDFPGLARNHFSEQIGVPVVHFNGAGGNIGAGKWNDGSVANRAVLADKIQAGMQRAWGATKRKKIDARDVDWRSVPVRLQPGQHLNRSQLEKSVADSRLDSVSRLSAAEHLSYLNRFEAGGAIDLGRLKLSDIQILHMPGELFVEYQLAAAALVPGGKVAMAAYGDYGTAYIGTAIAYTQGGYETSPRATCVGPEAEGVLVQAMATLLGVPRELFGPLGVPPDPPVVEQAK